MDTKSRIKIYPCKTILNRLSQINPDLIYRLQLRLPQGYEEACSLCEENKLVREWRYRSGEGLLQNGVIRVGQQEFCKQQERGVLQIARSPFSPKEDDNKNPYCYLLTKARVLQGRPDLLKRMTQGGYYALPFTTARPEGVIRIIDSLPSPCPTPVKGLLDLGIKRGILLIPSVPPSIQERCLIKSAAKRGEEAFAIAEPFWEEVLVITEQENVILFVQGLEDRSFSDMEFSWASITENRLLGRGRYLDLSSLKSGSHYLVCKVFGKNGFRDVATLNILVRPNPKLSSSSLFIRSKEEGKSITDKFQFEIFAGLSKKISLVAGKEGIARFYRVTRKLVEAELQLKAKLVSYYLQQGDHLFRLDPDLLHSFLETIENLERLDNQSLSKLFKAITRLFERPIEDKEKQRKEAIHLFDSINTFVDNNFSGEQLNDLFSRVPFEPQDHYWLRNLYAQQGLYEHALAEAKLAERESLDSQGLAEKFNQEIKKRITRGTPRRYSKNKRDVTLKILNTKTGEYETLKAKFYLDKDKGYTIIPPKLSSDYFDKDGNLNLRLADSKRLIPIE